MRRRSAGLTGLPECVVLAKRGDPSLVDWGDVDGWTWVWEVGREAGVEEAFDAWTVGLGKSLSEGEGDNASTP